MADTPMIIDGMSNGFGGAGLGAGFIGGLVLGSIWNGNGFGGWGGNRAGQVGADVAIANQLEHVSDQVQQVAIAQLQSANGLGMQLANSAAGVTAGVNAAGDQITTAINQGVITGLQTQMQTNDRLCCINNNITSQGYESRLQNQALAAQLQQQHAALSAQIAQENCADRELMRQIADQQTRDKLIEAQNENAALKAQLNLTAQLQNQTLYLINQLKPAETTAAAANG